MFVKNSKTSLEHAKNESLSSTSTPPNPLTGSDQIVLNCRVCQMINITDKKRILCPFCGSFYDPRIERTYKDTNKKMLRQNLVFY